MIFNGTNEKQFTNRKSLTFLMKNSSMDNVTGDAAFGISGEGKVLEFKFGSPGNEGGRMYDFDGNFVGSYSNEDSFEISGDISENFYNYSINGNSIARGIAKDSFKIDKFYLNTTGCTVNADLFIYGDSVDYHVSAPAYINVGDSFNISVSNISSDGKIYIYSAALEGGKSDDYYLSSFTAPLEVDYGQSVNLATSYGGYSVGNHQFNLVLDTNIGRLESSVNLLVSQTEEVDVIIEFGEVSPSSAQNLLFDTVNSSDVRNFKYYSTTSSQNQSLTKLSLEYSEGKVGTYYRVTGIQLTDQGGGYVDPPTITFGSQINEDISAEAEATLNQSYVLTTNVTNPGLYFGVGPSVTFSSPPSGENVAEGYAMTESYEKTFAECWDISTGVAWDKLHSFKTTGLTGTQGEEEYDYENLGPGIYEISVPHGITSGLDFLIQVTHNSFYDFDSMEVKLKLESNLADTYTGRKIEEVTISGGNTQA